jgi:hypothetical protein
MEEAPENGKESSHSVHASGVNVRVKLIIIIMLSTVFVSLGLPSN